MKNKIIVYTYLTFIVVFSLLHIVIKDNEISKTERRELKEFPTFEFSNTYITDIEDYLLDHFPLRDTFRSVKANFNLKVLNKLDNNNIYIKDNYIYKSNYPTNKKSINNFISNINKINNMLSPNNKSYIMIIPDKNYYLHDENFLHIDYKYIYNEINKLNINKIDIKDTLNINDYYETDTHWKQENLNKVVKKMSNIMDFNYREIKYKENTYNNFYGVYYGESAINRKPEKLTYLTNSIIDNVRVEYLENKKLKEVYNINNLDSLDAYEVYLDGASSFIEIYNKRSSSSKELVIFRDSFGSSLSPLLINFYSKITIIDNRYISSNIFKDYIEFNNQDVLFMYSTLIINDSFSLKG